MRRIAAFGLAVVMLLSLASCGTGGKTAKAPWTMNWRGPYRTVSYQRTNLPIWIKPLPTADFVSF